MIAHRGASAYRPEHTLAAYRLAIEMGADYIEPDLVSTKDGVLVARHENEISGTTDVAARPEFAPRRTTKQIDGTRGDRLVHRGLHARRAEDAAREGAPAGPAAGQHGVRRALRDPDAARRSSTSRRREGVGIYPETKHPTYFDSIGLSLEEPLVEALRATARRAGSPVFIQSFEVSNLQQLRRIRVPLVQLTSATGARTTSPRGDPRTYADLSSPPGCARSPATPTASGRTRT